MIRALTKSLALLAMILPLAACGLAETGVTAAAGASSAAEQAKQAKQDEAKVQQQINAAYQADEERRKAAEAQAQ